MARITVSLLVLILILAAFWLFAPKKQPIPLAAIGAKGSESWHDFSAPQDKFKIRLPSLPHHATETVEDPQTHEKRLYDFFLASKEDGTIFAVNTIRFPEKKEGAAYDQQFLRNFIQQMLLSNPLNKIKSMNDSTLKGNQAIDFKVENAEVTIDGKAFFDENTLYILSATARNDRPIAPEYATFIDSFQLPEKKH